MTGLPVGLLAITQYWGWYWGGGECSRLWEGQWQVQCMQIRPQWGWWQVVCMCVGQGCCQGWVCTGTRCMDTRSMCYVSFPSLLSPSLITPHPLPSVFLKTPKHQTPSLTPSSLSLSHLVLHGLRNQISSSAHSSVVRGHVDFWGLGSSTSWRREVVRLKSH